VQDKKNTSTETKKAIRVLDGIADLVLAYHPKPKTEKAKKRERERKKIERERRKRESSI
jgi:hypothetical protein